MAAFRFEAIDGAGKSLHGVLEADSARSARSQLRDQGLAPLVVEPATSSQGRVQRLAFGKRLTLREQALLTRQLASLLVAGLPLDESLSVVSEQAERSYVRDLVATIRAEVLGGQSLAGALVLHKRDFPDIYRALVSAGEHTGKLGEVMNRLADYLEQRNNLRSKIQLAFTYPAIVTVVAFGIVLMLLTYVVPQVVGVFAASKQKLPLVTIMMMATSDFVRHWGWLTAIVLALGVWLGLAILRQPRARLRWDHWILGVPILGRLTRDYNTVRFVSTLAILTGASVPILRALQAAGATLSNQAMQGTITDAIERVSEGTSLSRALAGAKTFAPAIVHLIRSGEATGNVASMLERAAEGESRELERRTMFLTSLLEPLLILAMGGVVLIIVLAVMMPIIELNQLVH